ncbi:MAG TPA: hypothetical protein DCZ05_04980, partial [Deltaproteobacteria bacterium]|nr:hypothetical protein [Deltaproteobacteria bacterium]
PSPSLYQSYDPGTGKVLEGIYLAGWSRNASVGLVGIAKKDAETGMKVVNGYLASKEGFASAVIDQKIATLVNQLEENKASFVTRQDIELLEAVEKEEAKKRNTWEYKFSSDEEMLKVISAQKSAKKEKPLQAAVANSPVGKS